MLIRVFLEEGRRCSFVIVVIVIVTANSNSFEDNTFVLIDERIEIM
jgi:hypothetical protein